MINSFFNLNRAALYREWRTSRAWLLSIGLLSMIGPVSTLLSAFYNMVPGNTSLSAFWYGLVPAIYDFHYSLFPNALLPVSSFHTSSDPNISAAWALIAVILGAIPWAIDRASGGIYAALTAPIKRMEIIICKLHLSFAFVLSVQLIRGGIAGILNAWGGVPVAWHVLVSWWITNTLCMIVAMVTATLLTTLVTAWLFGAMAAFASLYLPYMIASFLDQVVNYTGSGLVFANINVGSIHSNAHADPFGWLKALSPLKFGAMGMSEGGNPIQLDYATVTHYVYMEGWVWLFFGIWTCVAIWLAIRSFNHAPSENMDNLFLYPQMWKWLNGILSVFIGYLIAVNKRLFAVPGGIDLLISVLLYSLLIYLCLYFLIRIYHRLSSNR